MGVLMEKPDENFYGCIPDLCEALNIFASKQANSLLESVGEVFFKHGMCKDYGLAMIHRHFDLNPKEILVETIKDDETVSVAVPWIYEGTDVSPADPLYWNTYGLTPKNFVIPKTWGFTPAGDLKAFEYLSTEEDRLAPKEEFVAEVFQALKKLGIENIVGLRRTLNLKEKVSLEKTPDGVRANITKFGAISKDVESKNLVQAMWHFNADGKYRKNIGDFCIHEPTCSHSCCSMGLEN